MRSQLVSDNLGKGGGALIGEMDEVAEVIRAARHGRSCIDERDALLLGHLPHDVVHGCFHLEE